MPRDNSVVSARDINSRRVWLRVGIVAVLALAVIGIGSTAMTIWGPVWLAAPTFSAESTPQENVWEYKFVVRNNSTLLPIKNLKIYATSWR